MQNKRYKNHAYDRARMRVNDTQKATLRKCSLRKRLIIMLVVSSSRSLYL